MPTTLLFSGELSIVETLRDSNTGVPLNRNPPVQTLFPSVSDINVTAPPLQLSFYTSFPPS